MIPQQFQDLRDKIAGQLSEASNNLEALRQLRAQVRDLETALNFAITEAKARSQKLEMLSKL